MPKPTLKPSTTQDAQHAGSPGTNVRIYTDGGCLVNPGPGGYGVVLKSGRRRSELSSGFRRTTNNRMELMACIAGLKALTTSSTVSIYTDSRYLADGISKGWAKRWRAMDWKRAGETVPNADLWQQLLALCDRHEVTFNWLRGHAGNPENERCHVLADQAMRRTGLPADPGYAAARK
jgi:ribonuclease HI